MAVTTFEHANGKVFVAGLFWQPLSGLSPADRKKEIHDLAEEQDMDFMVTRDCSSPHVGLGSAIDGAAKGMYSAAAMISKTAEIEKLARNMLCAAKVGNDLWLYFAQRDGVVLSNGDRIGNEDEIRAKMLSDLSIASWDAIYAPEQWGIKNSTEREFDSFFPKKGDKISYKSWWQLKPIKMGLKDYLAYWPLMLAFVLLFAGAYGYVSYVKYKAAKELLLIQQMAEQQAQPVVEMPHPWKTMPLPKAVVDGCVNQLSTVSLWAGGWDLQDVTCTSDLMTITWKRPVSGLIENMSAAMPKAIVAADGNSATMNVPIVLTHVASTDEKLSAERDVKNHLNNMAQKYDLSMQWADAQPAAALLPGQSAAPVPGGRETWKEFHWTVAPNNYAPETVAALLNSNGIRLVSLKGTISNDLMSWSFEGKLYVAQ